MQQSENFETTELSISDKPKKKKFDAKQAFINLSTLKDATLILNDQPSLISLAKLYMTSVTSSKKLDIVNLSLEFDFCQIICNMVEASYNQLDIYIKNLTDKKSSIEDKQLEKYLEVCSMIVGIVRNFSNYSIKFIREAHDNKIVAFLFRFLKNKPLIDCYSIDSDKKAGELVRSVIGCVVNLSRISSSYSEKWKAENALETLLDASEKLKDKDDCQLAIYIAMANIADDNEIDNMRELRQVIPGIVRMIRQIGIKLETKKNITRIKVNLDENINETYEIIRVIQGQVIWHFVELVDALYHMACNDTIKYEIYETHEMKSYLRSIINHGNEIEVAYALKMLWQLCFDERVANDVRNDQTLIEKIKQLAQPPMSKHVIKNSEGILWLLEHKSKPQASSVKNKVSEERKLSSQDDKHIMISYNRETRDMCLKIKQELEKENFNVWIDVEDIHGSSLESMARAVENSICVLVCITEKYKMSPYCRAEAEYTFSLGKPFVPLIMQNNYKPDGWLG